jgi:hypothetical protein
MKQELVEGEDYYLSEKGLLTFTAKFLLDRGYCCGSGCRHCPYHYEGVPEPKRTYLLEQQKQNSSGTSSS